jgi:hypothetical protein
MSTLKETIARLKALPQVAHDVHFLGQRESDRFYNPASGPEVFQLISAVETLSAALKAACEEAEAMKQAGIGVGARDGWLDALAAVYGKNRTE